MTSTNDRWVVAVHEAGHGVAGVELGGRCVGLALTSDGGGIAGVPDLHGDRHVFMVAAGPAAEYLATEYDAPELPVVEPTAPVEDTTDDFAAEWFEHAIAKSEKHPQFCVSDDRTIALWAITGREDDPDSWSRRVQFAKRIAGEIVEANVDKIVRVAEALFIRGRLSRDEVSSYLNTRT